LGGKTEEIFEETDELYNLGLDRTRDRKYLTVLSVSSTTSEVRYLPSDQPQGTFQVLFPRTEGIRYFAEHRNGEWFILTQDGGKNFRIVRAPVSNPSKSNWREFVPHNPKVKIESIDLFTRHAVVTTREDGLQKFTVFDLEQGKSHLIAFPEPAYAVGGATNAEFETTRFRYAYESPITPRSVYEYDLATRQQTLLKQNEVVGGYDKTQYVTKRLFATASDGVKIPLTVTCRKGLRRTGKNPTLLYGYGSYGISIPDGFSSNRLSLLNRGMIFAVAHIRGGGEMGEEWHEQGKLMQKKNTFTDFIACAEFLIREKYTSPAHLAIQGGSAGGLLMGAVTNMRPDLFRVVISQVPFVDVMNTMLDPTLPLTTGEYIEWGNPNEKAAYDYMRSYSPYDNLQPGNYPAMLVITALNDSQVAYWEPAKYVAKLRTLKKTTVYCCSKPTWAPGMAVRRDATMPCAKRRFTTRFCSRSLASGSKPGGGPNYAHQTARRHQRLGNHTRTAVFRAADGAAGSGGGRFTGRHRRAVSSLCRCDAPPTGGARTAFAGDGARRRPASDD
jgi:oligopeptidase B